MLKIQNKSTKKIRITLIVFFMIQIFMTSQSFLTFPTYQTFEKTETTSQGQIIGKDAKNNVIVENLNGEIVSVKDEKGEAISPGDYVYDNMSYTVLDAIYAVFHHDASADFFSKQNASFMVFSLFLILPVIALLFQVFDFYYNIKNIVGFLVSAAGVILILNLIGLPNLGGGSLFSLIIYVFTAFMSVMGMMARYVKTNDDKPELKDRTESAESTEKSADTK